MVVANGCGHRSTIPPALPAAVPMPAPPAPASLPAPPAPASLPAHPASARLSTRSPQTSNDIFDKLKYDCPQPPGPNSSYATSRSPHKRAALKRQRSSSAKSINSLAVNNKGVSNLKSTTEREYVRIIRHKGRGRPVLRNSGKVLGVVTQATPNTDLNSSIPSNIISSKKTGTSTLNTTTKARHNGEVTRRREVTLSVEKINNIPKQKIYEQPAPDLTRAHQSSGESSSDDEEGELVIDEKRLFAYTLHNGGFSTVNNNWTRLHASGSSAEVSKELVIDEDDVVALRAFLERHAPDVSLHQFDYDDEYKRCIFYRLNPLVLLERSAQVRQMLRAEELSLRDFASQLGLRSVSDEPIHRREHVNDDTAKTGRKRKQPDRYSVVASPLSHKSPKKKQIAPPKLTSDKKEAKKTGAQKRKEKTPQVRQLSPPPAPAPRPQPPPPPQSPTKPQPPPQTKQLPRQQAPKPARGRGGGSKEYSRAEDAAIVNWISSEGRGRLVNGNRVWRDLQEQIKRLTGQGRTWQSLRNRYLRYILPSLSSLEVPPACAARLRADAAAGEIKTKRWPARRNSIFATPGVRGAWSRRQRSPLRTPLAPAAVSQHSPRQNKDAGNSASEDRARAQRSSSSDIPRRATRTSSGKPTRARSSSSEPQTRLTRSSLGNSIRERRSSSSETPMRSSVGKLKRARRSSSSEPQIRPTRSSAAKLTRTLNSTSSEETQSRPTRISMGKLTGGRRSSSGATPTRPTRSSAAKSTQARRSSSSEPQIIPTRTSAAKLKRARRSSSSEKPKKTRSSSSDKSPWVRRSSSSSLSSVSFPLIRGPNLRYSEVTRRFALRQKARQAQESSSPSTAPSPPSAAKGPRSRRLYNPKTGL